MIGNSILISVKSWSGFTQPSPEITGFFFVLEIFRKLCTEISVPSLQKTDTVCQDSKVNVVSLFYECSYHSESKTKQQETYSKQYS